MKKLFYTVIFISLFFSQKSFGVTDYIVAKINNKAITNSELYDRYELVLYISKIKVENKRDKNLLLNQILDKMVDEELIRQEAKELKIEVSNGEIRGAAESIAYRQKKNPEQLKLSMRKKGISFDNYLKQIESEILWSRIISAKIRPRTKVSEVEVKEFFEQRRIDNSTRKYNLSEIFIPQSPNSKQLAEKLSLELKNGANFENTVQQFSRSLSAENGGKIGWFYESDLDQKIVTEISKLQKGEYSNPIFNGKGYKIFKIENAAIENKIPKQDLAAAKEIIMGKKMEIMAKSELIDIRRKSYIDISF